MLSPFFLVSSHLYFLFSLILLIDQTKFYLKSHADDGAMRMSDLKAMFEDRNSEAARALSRRMGVYAANITGSPSYWATRKADLIEIVRQQGCPTIFFTLSYPDYHCKDLHDLMPGGNESARQRAKNLRENPHLSDWYFTERVDAFVKAFLEDLFEVEWYWFRCEWQSRGSCHIHGCARLKNDPGLVHLTKVAAQGFQAGQEFSKANTDAERERLNRIIAEGKIAESTIVRYADTLVSTYNPRYAALGPLPDMTAPSAAPVNHPHSKSWV